MPNQNDYYLNNKEKINLQHKNWYQNNKEKACLQSKEYYQKNKEKIKLQNKYYYQNNKEKCLQRTKKHSITIDGIYSSYKRSAKQHSRKFELTKDELAAIISQPCYYCGELQENFNGIDRLDNSKGYIRNNCIPCCSMCNRMKHAFTEKDFLNKCKQITEKEEVKNMIRLNKEGDDLSQN